MKKIYHLLLGFLLITFVSSCGEDFLEVIPDRVGTIDNAFEDRYSAEKFLFTVYSYMPNEFDLNTNMGFYAGYESTDLRYNNPLNNMVNFGQNTVDPYLNNWEGRNGGQNYWQAIRDCNIFLENIHMPYDLDDFEKARWIAEVKFLKAYYHYLLLRQYGPIPIIKENMPVSASPEAVKVYREPVQEVADYIIQLLDESYVDLPEVISNEAEELGRITGVINLAFKARFLTMMASPLFNGNPYYSDYVDSRGKNLFPVNYDPQKWQIAATAIRAAIDSAEYNGAELYVWQGFEPVSEDTRDKLDLRYAITDRWNREIIWGSWRGSGIQFQTILRIGNASIALGTHRLNPTLKTVERFYSKNGVPIDEDKTYEYNNRYEKVTAPEESRYLVRSNANTIKLHLNREKRFYSWLYFNDVIVYGNGVNTDNNYENIFYAQMYAAQPGGKQQSERYSITGYNVKKFIHPISVLHRTSQTYTNYNPAIIRLADLYLLYAEALNEIKDVPDEDVYYWIDKVRERASLDGVVESWNEFSSNPGKPTTKEGMREIIQDERLIELSFEGHHFWDMSRWRRGENEFGEPVRGWNVLGREFETFFNLQTISNPSFSVRDYFQPIRNEAIQINSNLEQTWGW